jgi:phosphoglycolate phosphatase
MMTGTVIFDFDGTLADSHELAVNLYNELARKHGYKKINEYEVAGFSKISIAERLKVLGVPFYRLPGLVSEMKRNYRDAVDSLKIVVGVSSVIDELAAAGNRLSLISSNLKSIIERFLANHNITYFEHIYCSKDLFGKSYQINRYLKTFHIPKEEVVYIGDEFRDIESCKKCRVRIIAVTWGYDAAELLVQGKPDFVVSHPAELVPLLRELLAEGR